MNSLLLSVGFGLVTAAIIALSAVGLTLQFGVTNFVNFAYGDVMTVGVYVAYVLNRDGMDIWAALAIAAVVCAVLAVAINILVIRPFQRKSTNAVIMLVVTIGLSLILQNTVLGIFGPQFLRYQMQSGTSMHFGPFIFTADQIGIMILALVSMVALHLLLQLTRYGKAMRAVSDNSDLARLSGIPVPRIVDATWALSGLLAGIAGVVLAINVSAFTPSLGFSFLLVIFAAVIVGGIGKPYGAMAAAVIIGVASSVGANFISSEYKDVIAFVILILVLLIRPEGIFQSRGRV